jgi:hypothetical protein
MFFKPNYRKAVVDLLAEAELHLLDAQSAAERALAELDMAKTRTLRLRATAQALPVTHPEKVAA